VAGDGRRAGIAVCGVQWDCESTPLDVAGSAALPRFPYGTAHQPECQATTATANVR
jgi:hypothetical protein